jgi:hypothetical protein
MDVVVRKKNGLSVKVKHSKTYTKLEDDGKQDHIKDEEFDGMDSYRHDNENKSKRSIFITETQRSRRQVLDLLQNAEKVMMDTTDSTCGTTAGSAPVSVVEIVNDKISEANNDLGSVAKLKWDIERKTMKEQIRAQEAHIEDLQRHVHHLEKQGSTSSSVSSLVACNPQAIPPQPHITPKSIKDQEKIDEAVLASIMGTASISSDSTKKAVKTPKSIKKDDSFKYGTARYISEKKPRKKDPLANTWRGDVAIRRRELDLQGLGLASQPLLKEEQQQPISRHSTGKINFFTVKKKDLWHAMTAKQDLSASLTGIKVQEAAIIEEEEDETQCSPT